MEKLDPDASSKVTKISSIFRNKTQVSDRLV